MAAAVLITGANRGLGFEFARQYVADGWRVFAACRSPAAATKLQRLAQETEGVLKIVAMNVTDAESVRNAATQLKDLAIDVLINSAGIAGAAGQKTGKVDYESSRTGLRPAEMEIGKSRAETGARNPPRADRNTENYRPENGACQPNPWECRGFSRTGK